jgi:hypothetical protein
MVGNQASRRFHAGDGVRQVDALAATLFTLALYIAIQGIQIQWTIVNQMTQLFGYADNTSLLSCSTTAVRELFQEGYLFYK